MLTAFGREEPGELVVLSDTFAQIASAKAGVITWRQSGDAFTFEADRNWIGSPDDLSRMLNGSLIPYPQFAQNASRIETTYRYLFDKIWYGPSGSTSLFDKGGRVPEVSWDLDSKGQFVLVLSEFGKYFWNEEPSVVL